MIRRLLLALLLLGPIALANPAAAQRSGQAVGARGGRQRPGAAKPAGMATALARI